MNSRIRKRAGQVTLNNPKEQSGLKTKGGALTSCFQVPGQVQLEGKKLTNRDFTTVLALLRGEGFQDDDFRYLNISENFLDHLPTNLPLGIQALHLGGNRFTSLIGFEHLQELERLDVSRNALQRSWGLLQNANLRHLNLAGNRIRVVEGLETLKLLEALDLSNNLIRTHDDMRALSFNGKLLSLRLEGNPVSRTKSIRLVVLHLLPSLRMLDGHRFLPFSRDPLSPTAQGPLSLHECSYMDIHQSRQVQGRSRGDMLEGPPPPASHPEAHAAAEEDASMDPPPRRYIPSWRCPPNPLPRGWKDYRQLAKESVGLAQPDRRSPSPDRRLPRRASPPRTRLPTQSLVLEDFGYSRCPEPNTFSYNYIVLPRPTLLEGGSNFSTLSPQREPAREGRGSGMQGPTARPTTREELLHSYQQWAEGEEEGGEDEEEEQQQQQQQQQQRQQQQQQPRLQPPQQQEQHRQRQRQQKERQEQQRGRGHEARDAFPAAPQHVSPPVPPSRERDMGRRRQSQGSHQPSYMPPPQLSNMTPPRASPAGRPASALSSLSVDERGRPPVPYGGEVVDASPGRSSDDSSSYGLDDGSHEMREIVKMLRDLLLQKRETIEMLMKSSEGGSLASPSDSGSAREGSSRQSSSA